MTIYRLPDWLGGAKANSTTPVEDGEVELDVWDGDHPSGRRVRVSEEWLGRLPDPDAPTPAQVLATPMGANDANASTIREYLCELLATLWERREGFSGKYPFGNSDWECALHRALAAQGYVSSAPDRWGELVPDAAAADGLIAQAIQALAEGSA